MLHPSHYTLSDYPNNIWQGVQIAKLQIALVSPVSCYFLLLKFRYLSAPCSQIPPVKALPFKNLHKDKLGSATYRKFGI